MLRFDLETNGLLDELTEIYCAVVYDTQTKEFTRYNNQNNGHKPIDDLYEDLKHADCIAHNGIDFDFMAMKKLRPEFHFKGRLYDSLIISRLIWPDLKDRDFRNQYKPRYKEMPLRLFGRHSLESWGHRLANFKDDFKPSDFLDDNGEPHTWNTIGWCQEMEDYCVQDVVVLNKLCDLIESKEYSKLAIELETDFAWLIKRQEKIGFEFDENKADELLNTLLLRRAELAEPLAEFFPPWYAFKGVKTTSSDLKKQDEALGFDYSKPIFKRGPSPGLTAKGNPRKGRVLKDSAGNKLIETYEFNRVHYVGGTSYSRIELTTFKPTSRDHIADRLMKLYGWKPTVFNEGDGKPTVDEEVLASIDHPSAKLLSEYLMIDKRIGVLSSGRQAWLKQVNEGRIYGKVNTLGAVTGRCTHSKPNVAQVPACGAPYGAECRELFTVKEGYKLVGADASGLELRCLAHFMAKWDEGAYSDIILNGDIHTENQKAAGLATRNNAKTFIYGFLYGAGDAKIGEIVNGSAKDGARLKKQFLESLPALNNLVSAVKRKAKHTGVLKGLDNRLLQVRSQHAALNTLLQSAGALIMKQALIELENLLQAEGLMNSWQAEDYDYEFVANIHDEFQIEVKEEHAVAVARLSEKSMTLAGEFFNFRCRIDGEAKIGPNWSKTH